MLAQHNNQCCHFWSRSFYQIYCTISHLKSKPATKTLTYKKLRRGSVICVAGRSITVAEVEVEDSCFFHMQLNKKISSCFILLCSVWLSPTPTITPPPPPPQAAVFHLALQRVPSFTHSRTEPFGISGKGFYGPDVLPVTQPTVSKHWRKECSLSACTIIMILKAGYEPYYKRFQMDRIAALQKA